MSNIKLAAAIAAIVVAFSQTAAAASPSEALAQTGIRTTHASVTALAKASPQCAKAWNDETRAEYFGACYGFPNELGSRFEFDSIGYVVHSEVTFSDSAFAEKLTKDLDRVFTKQAISESGLQAWVVGGEYWLLEPAGSGFMLTRTIRHDPELEKLALLKSLEIVTKY